MPRFRDSPEFKRGRNGERIVAGILQSRGWFVVPSYDYSGEDGNKAPKMQGVHLSLVIPDLDVARAGTRLWIEVKTKWRADFTRKTQRFEHGISKRHHEHYCRVERETGTPVWLFVLEESTGDVLGASLRALGTPRIYEGSKMDRNGMCFWPRDRFKLVATIEAAA